MAIKLVKMFAISCLLVALVGGMIWKYNDLHKENESATQIPESISDKPVRTGLPSPITGISEEAKADMDEAYLKNIPIVQKGKTIGDFREHAQIVVIENKIISIAAPAIVEQLKKCGSFSGGKESRKTYKQCREEKGAENYFFNHPNILAKAALDAGAYYEAHKEEFEQRVHLRAEHEFKRWQRMLPIELTIQEYARSNVIMNEAVGSDKIRYNQSFAFNTPPNAYQKDYREVSWKGAIAYLFDFTNPKRLEKTLKKITRKTAGGYVNFVEAYFFQYDKFFYMVAWGIDFPTERLDKMRKDFAGEGGDVDKFILEKPTVIKDCDGKPVYMQEMEYCYLAESMAKVYTEIYQSDLGRKNGKCLARLPNHRHCWRAGKMTAVVKVDNPKCPGILGYHAIGAATDINHWEDLMKVLYENYGIRAGCHGMDDDKGHASKYEIGEQTGEWLKCFDTTWADYLKKQGKELKKKLKDWWKNRKK